MIRLLRLPRSFHASEKKKLSTGNIQPEHFLKGILYNFICLPDRYAFQVLRSKNVTYNSYNFLALEVSVPWHGRSKSPNWCYDYQYLCEAFHRRPTGCGSYWTSYSRYSSCRDKYNSDMNIGDVLSCNPSSGVAAVANIAFPNLSPPAHDGINAFGFHLCVTCNKTLQASNDALSYMRGFWQSNMNTFYTVCR